jgi:hypothetical protein
MEERMMKSDGGQSSYSSQPDPFIRCFLIGGISGALSKTVTVPINNLKLYITNSSIDPLVEPPLQHSFKNYLFAVCRKKGATALWRGYVGSIIRFCPVPALNFSINCAIIPVFPKYSASEDYLKLCVVNSMTAGLAGGITQLLLFPLDRMRTLIALKEEKFSGLTECFVKSLRGPGGFLSLYQGIGLSLFAAIPARGVYLGMFESLKAVNPYHNDGNWVRRLISEYFIAQATVFTTRYIASPFDIIRRRLSVRTGQPAQETLAHTILRCFRSIAKEEGLCGFFRGLQPFYIFRGDGALLVLLFYSELSRLATGRAREVR